MRKHLVAVCGFAALAVSLSACKKKVDANKLEKEIQTKIGANAGVTIDKVDCPSGKEMKKDVVITCQATADGIVFDVEAKIQSTEGNNASIWMEPKNVMPVAKMVTNIQGEWAAKGVSATLDCKRKLVKAPDKLECAVVNAPDGKTKATITISDSGEVAWNLE